MVGVLCSHRPFIILCSCFPMLSVVVFPCFILVFQYQLLQAAMGALKNIFIGVGIALFVNFVIDHLYTKLPSHIDGFVDEKFDNVKTAFIKNFNDGWERDGAAFVVFQDGKKVVDLWGGYADKQAARKWTQDTMTITFSTTKAVAAVCVALLVERGRIGYDDLVVKHWPGFGKHGKGNVTVQMALSHMAGLAWLDIPITEQMAADHNLMREVLENEKPKWPPGERSGYHAYTYGWIVDQIIRHVDEKKRGVGQYFKEEVADKYGIDYHIGLPTSEQHRVARLTVPSLADRISEILTDYRVAKYLKAVVKLVQDTPLSRTVSNPSWLQAVVKCTVNNPDYHRLEQAAALGIGNARSLAKMFDLVATEKLLSGKMVAHLQKPFINETDLIMADHVAKANGMLIFPPVRKGQSVTVGHTGHGCQQVQFDPRLKLTIAYTSNAIKTGLRDLCRTYARLERAVYDVVLGEETP